MKYVSDSVRGLALRSFAWLVMACAAVLCFAGDLLAQTSGSSFPDLAEPVDITEVTVKVIAFLAIGIGGVLALKVGISLLMELMSWFGVKRRGVV